MVARVLAEGLAGIVFMVAGVCCFRTAQAACARRRAQAAAHAERVSARWRWFVYPRWWYDSGQDILAARGSAVGIMLMGVLLLIVATLEASHLRP
jgi:hypothetical protein